MQQGLSLAMQSDTAQHPCKDQDFNRYRLAQIRFRKSTQWDLGGHMFSVKFLFPCQEDDNSLKQLCEARVQDVVLATCADHKLDYQALGHVHEQSPFREGKHNSPRDTGHSRGVR